MHKNVGRLFGLALILSLLNGCATLKEVVKEPEVEVEQLQVKAVSLSDMQLDFILGVSNPNPVGISLSGMSYNLDVEGKSLFSGTTRDKLKVGANDKGQLTLPLTLVYEQVLGGVEGLLQRDTINYDLSGKLNFGLFSIPYSKRGEIKLPSLPDVSIAQVDVERMTLSGLDIAVALQMKNDNDFPLMLDGLNYGLKLADTTVASGKSVGPLELAPGESGTVKLGLSLGYSQLGGLIDTLRNSSRIPVAFEGELKVPGGKSVPLNWQGNVGVSH